MPKQLSGSTGHSDISVESTVSVDYSALIPLRDRLVDPDVPAASPSHRRSRSMLFTSCLVGTILAGGTSAVIAFRQFSLADIWRDRVAPKQLDRQDATASSSPPLASERNLEEAAAIPSSPSLGQSSHSL
jgi:hypothetical protein